MKPGPERDNTAEMIAKLQEAADLLIAAADAVRTVDVWISISAHHGTQFIVDNRVYQLNTELEGPITIRQVRDGSLIYRARNETDFLPLNGACSQDARTAA